MLRISICSVSRAALVVLVLAGTFSGCRVVSFDPLVVPVTAPPRVLAASVSVRCGQDVYKVSTGTSGGACTTEKNPDGSVKSAKCNDQQGNSASVSCSGTTGGCDGSTGSGGCEIK